MCSKNNRGKEVDIEYCPSCDQPSLVVHQSGLKVCDHPDCDHPDEDHPDCDHRDCDFSHCSVPLDEPEEDQFLSASIYTGDLE